VFTQTAEFYLQTWSLNSKFGTQARSGRLIGLHRSKRRTSSGKGISRGNGHVQQMRSAWRRTTSGQCTFVFLGFLFLINPLNSRNSSRKFRIAVDACENFTQPLELDANRNYFPEQISQMLLEVDHVFVLGVDSCETKLPRAFSGRVTCIFGRTLDACAPSVYTRGPYTHAMKVSFAHAAVLHLAQRSRYRHVAVLEDDIVIRHGAFSANLGREFRTLLASKTWSIIRFGFRPYFLEESSRGHCPSNCRCEIKKHIAKQFCELSRAGCDMRSSDFYVIREHYYEPLRSKILDLKQVNSKRIVDTRPMRHVAKQWLLLPQISIQTKLDIPVDYQIGLGALYVKKCVHPRPVSGLLARQFFNVSGVN
jgi:hypothetical protein